MRIIISPAKKMNVDCDSLPWRNLPQMLPRSEELLETLRSMTGAELKALWKCNDALASLNMERLSSMNLKERLTTAILAYEGIQYQYMAPNVFTAAQYAYIEEHLRILSGFYGILRPFDGVTPYRLEMQAKLETRKGKDLYSYWGSDVADVLFSETDCIINLASKEYSLCVSKYLAENIRFITCIFGEKKDGRVLEKGTMCKMARGEMVRFMAENRICQPKELKSFCCLGYQYCEERSDRNQYVFVRRDERRMDEY